LTRNEKSQSLVFNNARIALSSSGPDLQTRGDQMAKLGKTNFLPPLPKEDNQPRNHQAETNTHTIISWTHKEQHSKSTKRLQTAESIKRRLSRRVYKKCEHSDIMALIPLKINLRKF
jgi:hypothetical protein